MGKDVLKTIPYFGERGKTFKVYLRNVDRVLRRLILTVWLFLIILRALLVDIMLALATALPI